MAGLCAAARARELGAAPVVFEKGTRPGGSMLLSSCVIWRFRQWDDFRAECPAGDERLQRVVWERLDDGIAWLESLGAPVVAHETGNPRTVGKRFDPRGLTETLVRAAGDVRLGESAREPAILATGGFQGDEALVAEHIRPGGRLRLRANPWSGGDGLRLALERGAALSVGLDEFYGRNMPDADFSEEEFVPLAQLYGRYARVYNERGEEFFAGEISWSENDLVQATARQPGARAWYVLDDRALEQYVRERKVADIVALASTRVDPGELPFAAPPEARVAVRVAPGITHTIGGIRIDEHARVVGVDGLFAAGADAGGISTGGYASGLAAALVFGRIAAETALDRL
jgi:succinate dehydrogenase/fumarate reductase flavoprotein subunit